MGFDQILDILACPSCGWKLDLLEEKKLLKCSIPFIMLEGLSNDRTEEK